MSKEEWSKKRENSESLEYKAKTLVNTPQRSYWSIVFLITNNGKIIVFKRFRPLL